MKYPHISWHIDHDEILDHFTLSTKERHLLTQWRKEANILGFAVVLKSFVFLGFPPRSKEDVPAAVVSWVSDQLDLDAGLLEGYRWKDDNVWDTHLAAIRTFTGFRPCNEGDVQEIVQWLVSRVLANIILPGRRSFPLPFNDAAIFVWSCLQRKSFAVW